MWVLKDGCSTQSTVMKRTVHLCGCVWGGPRHVQHICQWFLAIHDQAIVSFVSGNSAQWGFLDSSLNTQFAFHGLRVRPTRGFIILLMPRHWPRVPALWCPAQLNLAAPPWPIGTFLGCHWLTLFQFHPAAAHPVRDGEGRRQWCSPKLNPNNYFRVSIIISKQNSYIKLYASAGATPPSSSSPPSLTSMSRCAGCDQCHVWQCRDTPRDNISPRPRDNGDRWRSWRREMCRSSCLHRRHHEAINLIKAADTKISRYSHLHNPHKVHLDTLTIWKLSCYPCNGHLSWPGKIDIATSYLCVDIGIKTMLRIKCLEMKTLQIKVKLSTEASSQ